MRFVKLTAVCVTALIFCGCDQGQPTPSGATADKQATTTVSTGDLAATKKAAVSGDATAQYNLAKMYENGDGVPQDFRKAFSLYYSSAWENNVNAMYSLARMYYHGRGVKQENAGALM